MINGNGIVKFGKMAVKVGLAVGSVYILSKANDELGKFGLNIGCSVGNGFDIHPGDIPKYNTKSVEFNANSVTERSIAELLHASWKTYSTNSKLECAKRIYNIALSGDDRTKLVAIQALGRIADDSYSTQLKNYVSKAITELAIGNDI